MAGVTTSLTTIGLDAAITKLSKLASFEMAQLAADAGGILESSTKGRFETKSAPDDEAWAPWSEAYAATRNSGKHSLLVGDNDLLESVQSYSTGSEAIVGSNLVYAAIQNFGGEEVGRAIPARPFLGLSDDDVADLRDLVTVQIGGLMQ